jgi:hypothetical protein
VRAFKWPVSLSAFSEAGERLVFEKNTERLAAQWAARHTAVRGRLSFDQERRLLTEEWARRHFVNHYRPPHLVVALALSPGTELSVIQRLLNLVISRQSALRSVFEPVAAVRTPERERVLDQAVHSGVSISGMHDHKTATHASVSITVGHIGVPDPSPYVEPVIDMIAAEASKPFTLTAPPLLRGLLIEGTLGRTLLVLTVDRLIADWRSMTLLRSELDAVRFDPPTGHHDPSTTTRRFPQRHLRRRGRESISYWRDQWTKLRLVPLTYDDLTCALPHTDVLDAPFGCKAISVPIPVSNRLREIAASVGESLEVLLLSAVVIVLQHATQMTTVSIWTDFWAVGPTDLESTFGPYSHSHAVVVELARTRTIWDVVKCVSGARSKAAAYAEMPLDVVWRAATKCWSVGGGQVSFQHLTFTAARKGDSSLITRAWPVLDTDARMALQFLSSDDGGEVSVCATYLKSCLPADSVADLVADISDVLDAFVSASDDLTGRASSAPTADVSTRSASLAAYAVTGEPAECYLCTRRDERRARGAAESTQGSPGK